MNRTLTSCISSKSFLEDFFWYHEPREDAVRSELNQRKLINHFLSSTVQGLVESNNDVTDIRIFFLGIFNFLKQKEFWNSLEVQWLGLCAFTAKGMGSIPAWETKIPQATQHGQRQIKIEEVLPSIQKYQLLLGFKVAIHHDSN